MDPSNVTYFIGRETIVPREDGKGCYEVGGAVTAPMEMFLTRKYDAHPTEIARLKGACLVLAHETQRGRSWDEAKIKNLTGGDKLFAGHSAERD